MDIFLFNSAILCILGPFGDKVGGEDWFEGVGISWRKLDWLMQCQFSLQNAKDERIMGLHSAKNTLVSVSNNYLKISWWWLTKSWGNYLMPPSYHVRFSWYHFLILIDTVIQWNLALVNFWIVKNSQ